MQFKGSRLVEFWAWLTACWVFAKPQRAARVLFGFARAEAQSELELREACALCTDVKRRALYLRHALDEARHATLFAEYARELSLASGGSGFARATADSESLFERLGEERFLAFVYVGERRGRIQFETYIRQLERRGDQRTASLFANVILDERRHEAYALTQLEGMLGVGRSRQALRSVRIWEAYRRFRRTGRAMAHGVYAVLMFVLYVLTAPFSLAVRFSEPRRSGWLRKGH